MVDTWWYTSLVYLMVYLIVSTQFFLSDEEDDDVVSTVGYIWSQFIESVVSYIESVVSYMESVVRWEREKKEKTIYNNVFSPFGWSFWNDDGWLDECCILCGVQNNIPSIPTASQSLVKFQSHIIKSQHFSNVIHQKRVVASYSMLAIIKWWNVYFALWRFFGRNLYFVVRM